jgi:U3 small nucleolar ribonucleoprotein protein IMP3
LQWKQDANLREIKVMRRYHIQQREDYQAYNRLCGSIRGLAHKLAQLPEQDPFRSQYEGNLLSKLYDMGILDITSKVSDIEGKVTVSALCRRRLAVVMCRLKMCETVSKVRIGS